MAAPLLEAILTVTASEQYVLLYSKEEMPETQLKCNFYEEKFIADK